LASQRQFSLRWFAQPDTALASKIMGVVKKTLKAGFFFQFNAILCLMNIQSDLVGLWYISNSMQEQSAMH
jgi:hypothetical protein